MKVFILTEAGQAIGFGHLSRSSSVYHAFRKRGIRPLMIIKADEGVSRFAQGMEHEILDWQENFQELLSRVAGADIVFIDSYLANEAMYHDIAAIVTLVACIDDYKRIRYPAGVVINGLIYAPSLKYPKTKGVEYLLGPRYALLRKAFWKVPAKKISPEIRNIFMTFGGSDFLDLAPETVKLVAQRYPSAHKTVVVSRLYKKLEEVKRAGDDHTRVVVDASDEDMKRLMLKSDAAVSASGQTLSELAVSGVPGVAFSVADNQQRNWKAWTKEGFIAAQPKAVSIAKALEKLESPVSRAKHSKKLRKSISASGVFKIVDALARQSSQIKNAKERGIKSLKIRTAQEKDCKDIWLWRNTHHARRASFQSDPIAYADHERWFERKTQDPKAVLWIAETAQEKVGHVRYEIDAGKATISIVLNPKFYGLGLGAQVIAMADRKLLKSTQGAYNIQAEIQDHHTVSVRAFTAAGYKLKERIVKNGKKAGVYAWAN